MLVSNCTACGKKKSRFIKTQEDSWLSSDLQLKTPVNKIPVLRIIFF